MITIIIMILLKMYPHWNW